MINDDISKMNSIPIKMNFGSEEGYYIRKDPLLNISPRVLYDPSGSFYDTNHVVCVLWNKVKELEEKLERLIDSLAI